MIYVCVPLFNPHDKFYPHFCEWYAANKARHRLRLDMSTREPLHKTQRKVVGKALDQGASHILFVEDDHWAFPINALDTLLEADKDMIGFHTFARRSPMISIAFKKQDKSVSLVDGEPNLSPIEYMAGDPVVQPMDLIGLGFTLIKAEVFRQFERDGVDVFQWTTTATDSHICQALLDQGGTPHVHFGWTMPHGDIRPETRKAYGHIKAMEIQLHERQKQMEKDHARSKD